MAQWLLLIPSLKIIIQRLSFSSHHNLYIQTTPYSPAYLRPLPPLAKLPTSTAIAPELTPSIFALHIPSYPIASKSYSRQNHRTCPTTHPDTSQSATLLRARALSFFVHHCFDEPSDLSNNVNCYIASTQLQTTHTATLLQFGIHCFRPHQFDQLHPFVFVVNYFYYIIRIALASRACSISIFHLQSNLHRNSQCTHPKTILVA